MSQSSDLKAIYDEAWGMLERGVADRRSPARHPTLATVSPDGQPQARTVVLRAASRAAQTVEFYSDTRAAKLAALGKTPLAVVHVWHPRHKLQIRLLTEVNVASGEAVRDKWERVPDMSRAAYGSVPSPGSVIETATLYQHAPVLDQFAVLTCTVGEIDLLHLGDHHRRAVFKRSDGWVGQWVAP